MKSKIEKIKNQFIIKSNNRHSNKYDYSRVEYINSITKVEIVCASHGSFWVRPDAHVRKVGCPKCNGGVLLSKEDFIDKASQIHKKILDYSKVDYINSNTKVEIICPIHNSFFMRPANHIAGQSCPSCGGVKKRFTLDFIEESKKIHLDKYSYGKVIYINNKTKVEILCNKHGYFNQVPKEHLKGRGCPKCIIYLGEKKIENILRNNNINYIKEYIFSDLFSLNGRKLPFDFYIPEYNICLEYDGRQHYEPVTKFGGIKSLEIQQVNDSLKEDYCIKNNILLLRVRKKDEKLGLELLKKIIESKQNNNIKLGNIDYISFFKQIDIYQDIFNFIIENYDGKYEINGYIINLIDLNISFRIISNYRNNELMEEKEFSNNIKLLFKNNKIKLVQIYEDLWVEKNKIVKSRILNLLGVANKKYARKYKIKEISKKEANIFLDKNHLQGKLLNGNYFISLVDEFDNIISIIVFGKLRRNLGNKSVFDKYELLRFCSLNYYVNIGSASKIIKYFISKYKPNSIISYADKNWTDIDNNLYTKINFKYVSETKYSYYYIIGRSRKNRFKLRKDVLMKKINILNIKNYTESDLCKSLNIFRIYNSGSFKFELKINK